MSKCVFRTDLRHLAVSEFLLCVEANQLFHHPSAPTVEECVHMLVGADEIALGNSDRREIMQGARLVGYIRIVDAV